MVNEIQRILIAVPNIESWLSIERYEVTILKTDIAKTRMILEQLLSFPEVDFVYPLIYASEDDSLILTNEIAVKLKPPLTVENLEEKYEVKLLREDPYDNAFKILKVLKNSPFNALEIANALTERGVVKYACPNFIIKITLEIEPNDDYYSYQWSLPKIKAPLAWDYETGSSAIVVAVIDGGVDLDHPDLSDIIVTGYDAVDGDLVPQCDPDDAHGTACAGIVAAITNNDEGVSGLAGGWSNGGGSRIMPIRIYSSNYWVSNDDIKFCFEWAAHNGANILSNSWSAGWEWNDILHAGIEYAVNYGCLVFFSAGNAGIDVRYPARDPLCIAVGATDQNDQRWYYSCFGSALDITAPSGDIDLEGDIWTTDNTGNDGYYPNECETGSPDGNYMGNFGGTSGACPHAAGLAALIWSKYPTSSASMVRYAIERGARDLGSPGWDQFYGWGRITCLSSLANSQPDNQIKPWWGTYYIGNDVYNSTGSGQYVLQFADPNQWAEYHIRIENDGDMADVFNVRVTETGTGTWWTRYYDALSGGNDITNQIKSASGWEINLEPGSIQYLRVEVKPGSNMNGLIRRVTLTSRAWGVSGEKIDVVYMDTQCNYLQPDNLIKNRNESVIQEIISIMQQAKDKQKAKKPGVGVREFMI